MVTEAKSHCCGISNIKLYGDDILLHDYKKSDLFLAYYTIQFVSPRHRQELFNKIYDSLNWGGAFVLFEKVRGPDARFQDIVTTLLEDFKKRNGFTAEEIMNKKESLKGVLNPF